MSTNPVSLQCQLLCACGCAYNVNAADGSYAPPADDPFGPAIGWSTLPDSAICISSPALHPDVSAAIVATINTTLNGTNTDAIVVAFRGTQPLSNDPLGIIDWLKDFMAHPVKSPTLQGKVHSGFLSDVNSILSQVATEISNIQSNQAANLPLIITGHSKGAAMATIGTALLWCNGLIPEVPYAVFTFGSPYAGDSAFVNFFETNIAVPVMRTENYLDIVPFLMPEQPLVTGLKDSSDSLVRLLGDLLQGYVNDGYMPLGYLEFIDENGTIAPPFTPNDSINAIVSTISESGGLETIGNAHNHNCGYGYMTGSCNQMGVCPVSS